MKIGFIGLGNMATAMIGGILGRGVAEPPDVTGAEIFESARIKAEERFGIYTTADNLEVVAAADLIVLAVKPQVLEGVLSEIAPAIPKGRIVLSIAPGKTLEWLSGQLGGQVKIVRAMPNTPALVGEGATGVCANEMVTPEELADVMTVLSSFGKAISVPQHLMDAVVGVSGSAPAYVFMFIEAMADAAVAAGMPRAQAYEFAAQATMGSAKMVLETGRHPGELKDMVCSPGGTTIEAVRVLEQKGFRSAVIEAIGACVEKSKGL